MGGGGETKSKEEVEEEKDMDSASRECFFLYPRSFRVAANARRESFVL